MAGGWGGEALSGSLFPLPTSWSRDWLWGGGAMAGSHFISFPTMQQFLLLAVSAAAPPVEVSDRFHIT